MFAALLTAPVTVAAGFAVLFFGGADLIIALTGVALWGTGLASTIVVYQQVILLTGSRAPETATSIGVLLAQTGFAAGATIGGLSMSAFGIANHPAGRPHIRHRVAHHRHHPPPSPATCPDAGT